MSILQIIKLESGTFKHVDSIDGDFFLGRFSFKQELNKAFLVEAYGAKRRDYLISEIRVFDYLGTAETFFNFTDLINRLTELGYTGIDLNPVYPTASIYVSDDVDNALVLGDDNKLFVPVSGGGGDDYLLYTTRLNFLNFDVVNDWKVSNAGFASADYIGDASSAGTGTTPSSTLGNNALKLPIPTGYIVDEILVNLNYKAFNTTLSTMQFFVQREETTGLVQNSTGSNAFTIANDTLVTVTGTTANLRVYKKLAINTHSLPSLTYSYLQFAIRETSNASFNALTLQIKFKKV